MTIDPRALERRRRHRLAIITACAIGLVPWTVQLATSLPHRYIANHWRTTWVGFDVILLVFFAATAWLGWHRRQLVVLTAFTTGVLLCCDAWIDVMTARHSDVWESLAFACIEIPLAIMLFNASWRLLRTSVDHYTEATHRSGYTVWTLPIPHSVEPVAPPEGSAGP
jgi:hypothetical protein